MRRRYESGKTLSLGKRMVRVEQGPILPVKVIEPPNTQERADSATIAVVLLRKYQHLFEGKTDERSTYLKGVLQASKRKSLYFPVANKVIRLLKEIKNEQ